jgi:hypothetical protein
VVLLETFRDLLAELERVRDQLARSREKLLLAVSNCCTMTTNYDKVGHGGGGGDARDGPLAALGDLMDKHRHLERRIHNLKVEIYMVGRKLRTAGHEEAAAILKYRYSEDLEWADVLEKLREDGMDPGTMRTLYRWHLDALGRAEKVWKERYEDADR